MIAERVIEFDRVVKAPRERVWQAWTNPDQIVHWFGPNGFTNTIYEMDVRVGGVWRFTMHGPDGTDYPNYVKYTQVVPIEKLAYEQGRDSETGSMHDVIVRFEDLGETTKVKMKLTFHSDEYFQRALDIRATEAGGQTLAKLEAFLQNLETKR